MMRRAVGTLSLTLLVAGCAEPTPEKLKLPIGAALDQTGTQATPSWEKSVQLAITHANLGLAQAQDPTFRSFEFDLRQTDTQNSEQTAKQRVAELVASGVKAVVIQQAPISIAVNSLNYDADPANDLNVPLMCGNCVLGQLNNPNATNPDPALQAASRDEANWFFRSVMSNSNEPALLLGLLAGDNGGDVNRDGKLKLGVYTANQASLAAFRNAVKSAAAKLNPEAIVEDGVQFPFDLNVNTYDFGADLALLTDDRTGDVVDVRPDALLGQMPSGMAAAVVKAYRTRGDSVRLLHTVNFRNASVLETLGEDANGQEGTSITLLEPGPSADFFREELLTALGTVPAIQDANFYDGTQTLLLATLIALKDNALTDPTQVTGAQVRDALLELSNPDGERVGAGPAEFARAADLIAQGKAINYEGASGPMDFDARGDVRNTVVHWKVQDKQFVELEKYDCLSSPACPRVP